jgi:hypothetical protein
MTVGDNPTLRRALSASAMPFRLVTLAACSALITGASFARAWRASRAAWRAAPAEVVRAPRHQPPPNASLIGDGQRPCNRSTRGLSPVQGRAPSPGRFSHGAASYPRKLVTA